MLQHPPPRSPEEGIRDEQATEKADAHAHAVVAVPPAVAVRPPVVWVGVHDMHRRPLLYHDTRLLQAGVARAGLRRASHQEDLPCCNALRDGDPHDAGGCMHLQLLARAHALWRNHLVERLVGRMGDCSGRRSRVILWPIKELSDCTLHISVVLLKEPKEVSLLGFGANNGAERRKLLD